LRKNIQKEERKSEAKRLKRRPPTSFLFSFILCTRKNKAPRALLPLQEESEGVGGCLGGGRYHHSARHSKARAHCLCRYFMLLCMHNADLIGLDGDILGLKIRVRNTAWSTMAFWGQVWAFRERNICMHACVRVCAAHEVVEVGLDGTGWLSGWTLLAAGVCVCVWVSVCSDIHRSEGLVGVMLVLLPHSLELPASLSHLALSTSPIKAAHLVATVRLSLVIV
jgi:hypothetical protein